MGRGIAQVALAAGHPVSLVDPSRPSWRPPPPSSRHASPNATRRSQPTWMHARHIPAIDQAPNHPDTVVIEAVLESLEVKAAVFAAAAEHFGDRCILATNTSSLSVTEIAARSPLPDRVVGCTSSTRFR